MVGMFFGGLSLGVAGVLLSAWLVLAVMEPVPVIGSAIVAIWYIRYTVRYYAAKARKREAARQMMEDIGARVVAGKPNPARMTMSRPLPTALDD